MVASRVRTLGRTTLPPWLFALFLLAFCFGTDDLVIAGILPLIADDLGVSIPVSGQAVTGFALTYALGAPLAALVTARLPRRVVLAGAAAVFLLANVGAAVAPTFSLLLVARVVAALAAATASPAAFAVAASLAPPGRQGRFLAVVSAGLTTSLVAGVPIGTWVGNALGWRATMLFVAAVAGIAAIGLVMTLPDLPGAEPGRMRDRLAPLRRPGTALALAAMVPGGAGGMMSYVYITEIAGRLGDLRGSALAPVITLVGLAGIGGTLLGGRAVDALGPERTLMLFLAGVFTAPALMLALGLTGGPHPLIVVGAVFVLYGVATWGIAPATQAWLLRRSGGSANELIALNNSTMFLGFSIAGGIGGLALQTGGPVAVPGAAAGCVIVGLALFALAFRLDPNAAGSASREE
jgi:predicted MFS family arabinose efflux permease